MGCDSHPEHLPPARLHAFSIFAPSAAVFALVPSSRSIPTAGLHDPTDPSCQVTPPRLPAPRPNGIKALHASHGHLCLSTKHSDPGVGVEDLGAPSMPRPYRLVGSGRDIYNKVILCKMASVVGAIPSPESYSFGTPSALNPLLYWNKILLKNAL